MSASGAPRRESVVLREKAPHPLGAYSHAIKVSGLVFVAGMGARDAETGKEAGVTLDESGKVTSYDIEVQTHAVIKNLTTVLRSAGCTLHDVVDMTVFLADMKDFDRYNRVYKEYFSFENPPARTTVQVVALPGNNYIEMKAIAFCPQEKSSNEP